MATATDAGVRKGTLQSAEMRIFLLGGGILIANGTAYVDVPWDVVTWYLGLGSVGMGGRILQKTVATYTTGKAPIEKDGDRNVP